MAEVSWFQEGSVLVSSARSCGVADRSRDELAGDVAAAGARATTASLRYVALGDLGSPWVLVPTYFDARFDAAFDEFLARRHPTWSAVTLGELITRGWLLKRAGHGTPRQDQQGDKIAHIKASDLRSGLVTVNPSGMVSEAGAEQLWGGADSGLAAYDLVGPERTPGAIGEFCVLLPGQERSVLSKDMVVLRCGEDAPFDASYLLWALSLSVVRDQWSRITFQQATRLDVGDRFREIRIPLPPTRDAADDAAKSFSAYLRRTNKARAGLAEYLAEHSDHRFFLDA